ncbi:trypsin-like serine peptidase [Gloeobacter violaceus]|uniref:Gll2699 protein n=1 Tax=Gloeobacter violaceus (strain ATCC 29082 / PCC 7421) TaxID=251221 RepID=Q7NH38_GLOVI|nr:trypsin-like peptidase domain-containing protein [Gloeobacter violaceus]BAC90640.1 gll2699 [Gloeobacter violaceus PCC 7421]
MLRDYLANRVVYSCAATCLVAGLLMGQYSAAFAQEAIENKALELYGTDAELSKYWTPERLRNAKPMPLPAQSQNSEINRDRDEEETKPSATQTPASGEGKPPSEAIRSEKGQKLFAPDKSSAIDSSTQPVPQDVGNGGAYFTSSQLVPLSADAFYPYSTVGKFFFTKPGVGDFVCSASVLRPRVILTAGHCIHSGNGSVQGYYQNFLFVPSYNNGFAPYGVWNWAYANTTSSWYFGGGSFPNAADFAMLQAADNPAFGTLTLGSITGYLGYQTLSLLPNHAISLGYPGTFDSGLLMHQVTSGSYRTNVPNSVEYGSDMTGGSSGGPWIQNFGFSSSGQFGGLNAGRNRVIGVTSYGYVDPTILLQGSSVPDSQFLDLLNNVCLNRPGNC